MSSKNIGKIVEITDRISTLPGISPELHKLLSDDNVSLKQIGGLIEKDPYLTARIIKILNSSFYGTVDNISSVDHALTLMGVEEVKNIILGIAVQNSFDEDSDSFDRNRFWEHSGKCSQTAKILGNHFNVTDDGTFFLSGLIHDIGKLVFDKYFHEEFNSVLDYISTHHCSFSTAEKETIGITHYQIAAKVLQQWGFPKNIIMPVFFHHAPWNDKESTSGSIIVYLSNVITKIAGHTCFEDEKKIQISDIMTPAILNFIKNYGFDLDQKSFEVLISNIK